MNANFAAAEEPLGRDAHRFLTLLGIRLGGGKETGEVKKFHVFLLGGKAGVPQQHWRLWLCQAEVWDPSISPPP